MEIQASSFDVYAIPAWAQVQTPWKRLPEHVSVLSVICSPACTVCTLRVTILGVEPKVGGELHLKLHICFRPIANKYYEEKMQRTLKRELKVPEIAESAVPDDR